MTLSEKMLYHQIHPFKLFTDIFTSILSTYFLWHHHVKGFLIVFLLPSVIVTILLIQFADLEKLKESPFGKYVATFMNRKIEALRFFGQFVMWYAAWFQLPWMIASGVLIIVGAWLSGFTRLRKP